MKRLIFLLLIFLNLFSCSKKEDKDIISKDKMVNILVDIHLADAYVRKKGLKDINLSKPDSLSYYNWIFKKYGITREEFYQSFEYYMLDIEDFKTLYQRVLDTLKNKLDYYDQQFLAQFKEKNLWKLKQEWSVPEDSNLLYLFYKLDNPEHGVYTLRAEILIYPDDLSRDLRMVIKALYEDSSKVTRTVPLYLRKNNWKKYQVVLVTDTTKKLKTLYFYVLYHDLRTSYMHLQVRNIFIVRTGFNEPRPTNESNFWDYLND